MKVWIKLRHALQTAFGLEFYDPVLEDISRAHFSTVQPTTINLHVGETRKLTDGIFVTRKPAGVIELSIIEVLPPLEKNGKR